MRSDAPITPSPIRRQSTPVSSAVTTAEVVPVTALNMERTPEAFVVPSPSGPSGRRNNGPVLEAVHAEPAPADRGVDYLREFGGIFVRQRHLDSSLTLPFRSNTYDMLEVQTGHVPVGLPSSDWTTVMRNLATAAPMMSAAEESSWQGRCCLKSCRSFKLNFRSDHLSFTLERPFICEPNFDALCIICAPPVYMPPCGVLSFAQQNLAVQDAQGGLLARAQERPDFCPCRRTFGVTDTNGSEMYRFRACECRSARRCNACAPTACNSSYTVDVLQGGELVSESHFLNPGPAPLFRTRSNFIVTFPDGASATERVGLIAGMMLIEYSINEKKQSSLWSDGRRTARGLPRSASGP